MKLFLTILFLTITNLAFAETKLVNGVVFTRVYTSPMTAALEAGNKIKKEIAGQWVFIKKMKANTFIPAGSIIPIQILEDADLDGNTDYVIVRVDTWERIAKNNSIKATDSVFVSDVIDER